MKNAVLLISLAITGMLTLTILNTIYGRMDRVMELESNLSSVVEETLEDMVLDSVYSNENMESLIGTFAKSLLAAMDTPSDLTIDVLQCDMEKGILSVRVTLSYIHPNESVGKVVCEKHVILNRLIGEVVNDKENQK